MTHHVQGTLNNKLIYHQKLWIPEGSRMFKVAIHQEDKTIKTYRQEITEPQNIRHTLMN